MKTALITGASSGFGKEFARIFAQDGYNLVITARSTDKLEEIKRNIEAQYGVDVFVFTKDLSLPSAPQELFDFTQHKGITVDVLVNNAGFGDLGDFKNSDLAKQKQMINLNVSALVELTHLYLPDMLENSWGRILNVASVAAFAPGPGMSVYYASKAFVLSFSDALATELKGTGVTVTALCPGPVNTGFAGTAGFKNNFMFSGKEDGKAAQVSRYGYNAMKKGKAVALPDILVRAAAVGVRLVPRKVAKNVVYALQSSRKDN